jgi:hypothetical protein
MAKFNTSHGRVMVKTGCCNTTRSMTWVSTKVRTLRVQITNNKGHCWADTEPNLSQISVPQLPTVIRASEIIMKFFDAVAEGVS